MVVTTVALGKDHSVDLYCERSKTAEAEALLHKPWVGLTEEEQSALVLKYGDTPVALCLETERKLKEHNT
jgi:hypothetical protein